MQAVLARLVRREDLDEEAAAGLMRALTDAALAPALAGAVLAALRSKGETAIEVRGFAAAMRALARAVPLPAGLSAVDVVGTGGDASGSLNLSTGAALLTAACGLPVVKHGNRSVSSRSGSADVLEALGIPTDLSPAVHEERLLRHGLTFLFAPAHHPALRHAAPTRRELGVRTFFNLLGPLANPAFATHQLVGLYDP